MSQHADRCHKKRASRISSATLASTHETPNLPARIRGAAAPAFPAIAQEFCERIREHAVVYEMAADDLRIRGLSGSLIVWMAGMFGGVYDEHYYQPVGPGGA